MKKEIYQKKAQRIVEDITNSLLGRDLTEEEVRNVIRSKVAAGYNEDGPEIFKSISLILHPDKIKNGPLSVYLDQKHLKINPQQVVNDLKSEITAVKKYDSIEEFNRYVQPFRTIVNGIYWVAAIAWGTLYIPIIIVELSLLVTSYIINGINSLLINLSVGSSYRNLLEQYQQEHFEYYKKFYLAELRISACGYLNLSPEQQAELSDVDFFEMYVQLQLDIEPVRFGFAEEEYKTRYELWKNDKEAYKKIILDMHDSEINKRVISNNFNRLLLVSEAFYSDITRPLNGNNTQWLAVSGRAIKLLISPIVLSLVAFNDLFSLSLTKGIWLIDKVMSGIFSGITYVLNGPLFIYDAIKPALRKINSFFNRASDFDTVPDDLSSRKNPYQRLIEYSVPSNDSVSQEPGHHNPVFSRASGDETIEEVDSYLLNP